MKILLNNVAVVPVTGPDSLIEKGYLVIEGNLIKELGEGVPPDDAYDKVIDGTDKAVLPGLINTHTHAAMTLLRGYADDLPLMEWLETKIWPLEAKLTSEDIYWGTMLAVVEMIKSGTTTFADMYFSMEQVARAVKESGMRGVLARGMIGVGPDSEKAIIESEELVARWHKAANERILCMLGPHAPYTCPPGYLQQVAKIAGDLQVGIHIHVSETRKEFEDFIKQYGKTPVEYLEDVGILQCGTLAAHCVHLSDRDIEILKKHNVGVAHNPESNMKLASGVAPVPDMLEAGLRVALGTDGASSNNDLDMIQEMRTCALLHKVSKMDPTVLPAYQVLEMATANGAKVLGLEGKIGQLAPEFKADMILINLKGAHMTPCHDILANIVYSAKAGDVDTVIIDGNIVMEDRKVKTIDEEEILSRSGIIAKNLVKRVGM